MLLFNAMGICKELAAVCYFNTSHVIIQQRKIILKKSEEQISIHPMLLFSFIQTMVIQLMYHISIHPMLLFSFHPYIRCTVIFEFQYILCYYSAFTICKQFILSTYFNTSYVIIQPTKNRHSCILLISINHDLKPFSNILPTIPLKISYS